MIRMMRGYQFTKTLSGPKQGFHFFKNTPYVFWSELAFRVMPQYNSQS